MSPVFREDKPLLVTRRPSARYAGVLLATEGWFPRGSCERQRAESRFKIHSLALAAPKEALIPDDGLSLRLPSLRFRRLAIMPNVISVSRVS